VAIAPPPAVKQLGRNMITVVLVIHLLIAIAMVGVILLQRSEGGALGIGGGGGGGLVTGRAAGNILTRTTAILATAFFATSLLLAILANQGGEGTSIIDETTAPAPGTEAPATVPGVTPQEAAPTAPEAPAEPAAPAAPIAE